MKQYSFKTIIAAIGISFAVLSTSCTGNFDDLNLHPTNPTEDDMTSFEALGLLFPTLISTMHYSQENRSQMIDQMVGGQYGGYFATTNNWQGTNFGTFNPTGGWVDYPYTSIMVDFNSNYVKVKRKTESNGYAYAWTNIIRVATMLRVTDTYGPIPYSKVGSGDLRLEYDNVQNIYNTMIDELNRSILALSIFLVENQGTSHPLKEYDIVYNGDFSKWIKFANSLKLRIAVRMAGVDTEYAKKAISEAIASGSIESNGDNAFIPTADNPYYKASVSWGDLAVSATLSSYMNGFSDPRCSAYMTRTVLGATYRGVRMGIENINQTWYSNTAYYSKPAFTPASPLLVFCAAETAFLKAEAALKGWIAGGDAQAQAFYEQGIRLSMEQHGVNIGTYLSGITSPEVYRDPYNGVTIAVEKPITVSWNDAGTDQNTKLEKIITQKWLAVYPLGFEAWCDQRRTGFPQFFPAQHNLSSSGFIGAVTNTSSRLTRRLPYPQAQYLGNSANVQTAVSTMLGGDDDANTDIWWAKKP